MSESEQTFTERRSDQIVVALEHLQLLRTSLDALGIAHTLESESEDLGLALLTIADAAHAAVIVKERADAIAMTTDSDTVVGSDEADNAIPAGANRYWPPPPDSGDPMDVILWALRRIFKHRHAGWSPTMGKNREIGHVHGVWAIIHSEGDPLELEDDLVRPARAQGPGTGVRVGVLDTGLYPQSWLAGGWSARYSDLLSPQDLPTMAQGHATFVTGLVLDQAPGAVVVVRQLLDADGRTTSWHAAEEIVRMGRSGVDVINLSFACYTDDDEPPLVLAAAVDRLDPNIVVVAAAGNSGRLDADGHLVGKSNRPAWPAALDDVIAVGAARSNGQPARFSPSAPWVDVLACGVDLISTYPDTILDGADAERSYAGGWAKWSGTSFASALIAGAIAAGTVPGRVSPAEAARDIIARPSGRQGTSGPTDPKFVPLRTG